MNICILGWYGTETLGDRAILDGIIRIYAEQCKTLRIKIGSLYPFFTERTLYEDTMLYNSHGTKNELSTFDVYNKRLLHKEILDSDYVIMGGGPLMDLNELYIIQHAFRFAKKHNVSTALLGCGYGPLKRKEYIKCVRKIANESDLIIMRSELCKHQMIEICSEDDKKKIFSSLDPATISVMDFAYKYRSNSEASRNDNWVINIRDLDYVYNSGRKYIERITNIVKDISEQVPHLVAMPMHSFSVGGDDRYIQNSIARKLKMSAIEIEVVQRPPTLQEAYEMFMSAKGCIGMRYHSVVFQTYLNGNNYIIDYTDPINGKIRAFLDSFDSKEFYRKRYINITVDEPSYLKITDRNDTFRFDFQLMEDSIQYYNKLLAKISN